MAAVTLPTKAESVANALEALDALLAAAQRADAAVSWELYPEAAALPTAQRASHAAQYARAAAVDAMRVLAPDADDCAYCGTRWHVTYYQRGDMDLCQRCGPSAA